LEEVLAGAEIKGNEFELVYKKLPNVRKSKLTVF
jgi:hypothetical protein